MSDQDERTDDGRPGRGWAEELAWRLASPEGLRLARLLQASGVFAPAAAPVGGPGAADPPSGPRPISIWRPRQVDGELRFVRPEPPPWGDHHAAVRSIPAAKRKRRRVCLFGESVAAGYLYAPHLTPARLLEEQLAGVAGADAFEVVDLARTNERLAPLADTVEAALQLEPDVLVIWVGNNWTLLESPERSPYAPGVAARQRLAGELADGGPEAAARGARLALVARARRTFERVAELAAGRPVVLLVPEVNLADWENRQPPVWLPGGGTGRWHQLYRRSVQELSDGDHRAAEQAAWAMIELDGGFNPTPFRLLSRALCAKGDAAAARDAAVSEVDALHYPLAAFLGAPQAGSVARELLLRAAGEHGFTAVDLRPVLRAAAGDDGLPGRRWFLDYCHLTAGGLHRAMAAATAAVLRATGEAEVDPAELASRLPAHRLAPEAEAVARLGAAIHTAHRMVPVGSPRPILEHWCRQAVDASPGIVHAMLDLVAARSSRVSPEWTAAQRRNWGSAYPLSPQHGWLWPGLDVDVILALLSVLEQAGVEWDRQPVRQEIERRLIAGLEPPREGTDLARGERYLAEPLVRFLPDVMRFSDLPGRATFRAPWPESSFCLVTGGERNFELRLTARLPPIPGWSRDRQGAVAVSVNGTRVGEVGLTGAWRREVLRVGRRRLARGINQVSLHWPPLPPAGTEAMAEARRRLESGLPAELHPVFGEVFALVARPV